MTINTLTFIMESPYNGRAEINNAVTSVEIIIPTSKNYFVAIFMGIWLTMFGGGFIVAIVSMLFSGDVPIFVPFIFLAVFGLVITFVGRIFWWMVAGKEVVLIDQWTVQIRQKGLLFSKPKVYDINECRGFRVVDNGIANAFPFVIKPQLFNMGASVGTIAFDYGMKTIKFAAAIDEAEGRHILNMLREKNYLTDKNF